MSKNVRSIYSGHSSSSSTGSTANQRITMMPIGVPKVAYRVPGSQSADWYVFGGMPSIATHIMLIYTPLLMH
jgi:hypothetical protein